MLSAQIKKLPEISNLLNHITLVTALTGVYIQLQFPSFFLGKSSLFAQTILPVWSALVLINSLLIFSTSKSKDLKIIPKNKIQQSLLLFATLTTLFSFISYSQNILWYFSGALLILNLQQSKIKKLQKTFFFSTLAIALIAITQFFLQTDLNLHFLGEPIISSSTKGISKLSNGIVRSYGLSQHPNILGAILTLSTYLSPYPSKYLSTQFLGLFTTFSLSNWIATGEKFIQKKTHIIPISILLLIIMIILKSPEFLIERLQQITNIIYNPFQNKPWQNQPIHNTFLLSLLKFGPIHTVSLLFLLFQFKDEQKNLLIALIILMLTDHFFLTSFQAYPIFLVSIYLASAPTNKAS